MGLCACPRCLTPKKMFGSLGLPQDMKNRLANLRVYVTTKVVQAREFIYKCGNTVDGLRVEQTLGEGSWVPTMVSTNSFAYIIIVWDHLSAESIHQQGWTVRPRPIPHACCRLHARMWIRHVESAFYTPDPATLCASWGYPTGCNARS